MGLLGVIYMTVFVVLGGNVGYLRVGLRETVELNRKRTAAAGVGVFLFCVMVFVVKKKCRALWTGDRGAGSQVLSVGVG